MENNVDKVTVTENTVTENTAAAQEDVKKRPGLVATALILALGIAIFVGSSFLWNGIAEPRLGSALTPLAAAILRQMVVPYVIGLGLCLLLYRLLPSADKSDTKNCRPFTAGDIVKGVCVQTGAGMVLAVAVNIIIIMLTGRTPEQTQIDFGSLYTVFLLLVFAPVVEEFLFRKLTIDRLRRFGKYPAVIISAVMFAVPHIFSQGVQACAMTFIAGLVWGYIYYRTDRLLPCVIMHMMFNLLNGYLASFLTTRGGMFMAAYFLIFLLAAPVLAAVILARNGKAIFSAEN